MHLRSCRECSARLGSVRAIDRSLRSLPLEKAPAGLSRDVLAKLGVPDAPSWIYTLLKNIAPLVALTAVLIVVYLALGKSPGADAASGGSNESARGLLQMAEEYTALGVRALNAWAGTYFSFAKSSAGLAGFLVAFLAVIALLDRYLVMPFFRKRV
jgi:hypothetical protein